MHPHKPLRILLFTIMLVTLAVPRGYSQANCPRHHLLGEWKEVASLRGESTNIDSLRAAAASSKRSLGTWQFKDDNTYKYRHPLQRSRYKRNSVFALEDATCEIILGRRKHKRDRRNLEIIYLDEKLLIYKSDNNPKGYFTHVLIRNKKKGRGD